MAKITVQFEIDDFLAYELIALYCALVDEDIGTNCSHSALPAALHWIRHKDLYTADLAGWDEDDIGFMEWFTGPYKESEKDNERPSQGA